MIWLEKIQILTPLQKLSENVGDLGKLIVAKCFEKLPKVQYVAQSGRTGHIIGRRFVPNQMKRCKWCQKVSSKVAKTFAKCCADFKKLWKVTHTDSITHFCVPQIDEL